MRKKIHHSPPERLPKSEEIYTDPTFIAKTQSKLGRKVWGRGRNHIFTVIIDFISDRAKINVKHSEDGHISIIKCLETWKA